MTNCPSCGISMPAETLCDNCRAPDGGLRDFEETLERFSQWAISHDGVAPQEARAKSLAYMATRPAWKDHPAVLAALAGPS